MANLSQSSDSKSRKEAIPSWPAAPQPRVLIAEDHEDTRFMLKYLLLARGYGVLEADNGDQAVELAERERPDLILMDVSLPRLDGFAVARRIRELVPLGGMPIVFLSGHAEPAFRVRAMAAGGDDYLVKPFDFSQLYGVLEKHLGKGETPYILGRDFV